MGQADPNPEYWGDYSKLQRVKHQFIREYLKGWLPKLTLGPTGCRRLLYIDTHAGRGKHQTGHLGSPLVALTTLLEHTSRSQMLRNTEVRYYFIEGDEETRQFRSQGGGVRSHHQPASPARKSAPSLVTADHVLPRTGHICVWSR